MERGEEWVWRKEVREQLPFEQMWFTSAENQTYLSKTYTQEYLIMDWDKKQRGRAMQALTTEPSRREMKQGNTEWLAQN
jgi:predicted ATPase